MRLATIVSLSASAVLGVGALFVAKVWLPANSGPSKAVAAAPIALTPVVAAKAAIPFGHKLEAKDLMLVRMPADAAPTGAFHTIDEVIRLDQGSAVTLTSFSPKEPILPSKVSGGANRASLSAVISPGMRAYTIKVNDTYGGGGHILPGDRVDVLMAKEVGDGKVEGSPAKLMVAYVIIQDVRVLGMDLNADPASVDKALPKTATLEVSVTDAEKLSVAGEAGILSLALRRIGSAGVDAVGPVRSADLGPFKLVDPNAPRLAARRPARKTSPAKPTAPAGSTLTITQGGKATTVSVPTDRSGARW
ncbi:pilus assembly protein CpaB [Caulobacter ginsengisoli]|uniref:Pilus assembly protein CpaB n=1 Tax=Caulobacter ginsengisoli TaxID=400775 RepID=A0ABU0IUI6_9CAUL|nr:Flp pilus assembly protein CpaB [Caulobacter ginsengisoli]MDQ0464699.1 pilus assembly protein CpaB [Caulobacter ginsengisoli]